MAKQEAAAKLMAEGGDYSLLGQMYGLSNWQTALLGGSEATKTTVKALTANGVSEADRTGVMKTVRSMYTQMRASGATQAELDNYLVELRNAGILQKYEDAEIREDRNWSASASASTSDTGTTTTGEAAYTGPTFDKDSYLADTTEDLAVMLKDAEDWRNISQTYGGVHISRLPEDVKKRVTHYLEKYGSYDNLRKQMEGTYTGSNAIKYSINTAPVADPETYFLENATAIASKHHLATPTLTEKVVNFFNSTPSLAMALQQGLTKEEYRTMLTDRLFTLDLTEGEYSAILIASGLYT